jgi:hypothetical protein
MKINIKISKQSLRNFSPDNALYTEHRYGTINFYIHPKESRLYISYSSFGENNVVNLSSTNMRDCFKFILRLGQIKADFPKLFIS